MSADERAPVARPAPGRYGALLILLIASYLLSALIHRPLDRGAAGGAVHRGGAAGPAERIDNAAGGAPRAVVAVVGTAAMLGLSLSTAPGATGTGIADVWTGVVLLAAVVVIVRRVLAFGTVTLQSIYGAISAYLIIGFMFAAVLCGDLPPQRRHFFVATASRPLRRRSSTSASPR